VPSVGTCNCLQNIRMDTGIIVAGKAAGEFHGTSNVAEVSNGK
jgi:hypothetical protein